MKRRICTHTKIEFEPVCDKVDWLNASTHNLWQNWASITYTFVVPSAVKQYVDLQHQASAALEVTCIFKDQSLDNPYLLPSKSFYKMKQMLLLSLLHFEREQVLELFQEIRQSENKCENLVPRLMITTATTTTTTTTTTTATTTAITTVTTPSGKGEGKNEEGRLFSPTSE